MAVRWPGNIKPNTVSDFPWTFYDFLPTALDIATAPAARHDIDGMSVLPALLGKKQKPHDFFYWEFYSPFQQAVRVGNLKGISYGTKEPIELYDINKDQHEDHNIAAQHPLAVKQMEAIMTREHVDSPYWPTVEHKAKSKPSKNKRSIKKQ